MPVLHIIATGQPGSGKSMLIRHLATNPPKGWKLLREEPSIPSVPNTEYWCLVFEKIRPSKRKTS